jgi:hypothetical protein
MDIDMPEMDGLQATREIIGFDNTALIVMCSAIEDNALEATVEKALQAGATGFVAKPFKAEALLEKVKSAVSLGSSRRGPSSDSVKELIALYVRPDTENWRDLILRQLLLELHGMPLIFPTDAVIPQATVDAAKDLKPGDSFSFQEDVGGNLFSFEQDGITYVPAFTDNDAYAKSKMPFSIILNMHPSSYLPVLRNKTYDRLAINPEEGAGMFALPKEMFESAMGIISESVEAAGRQAEEAGTDVPEAERQETPMQTKHGRECCLFSSFSTAHDAMKNRQFEEIEHFGGKGEGYSWEDGSLKLHRCKNCGALFVGYKIDFRAMTYEDDEESYSYFFPVGSRSDALEFIDKNIGKVGLKDSYTGTKIWYDSDKWNW